MSVRVIQGDCLGEMRALAAVGMQVQAIVTDPPAGIAFMGKEWDRDKGGRDAWIAWMRERAEAALALVPPGGHALVWALPRTTHWTVTAWEDAGWEVRDRVAHLFGTGFPKSKNVALAIDKGEGHGNRGRAIPTASTSLPSGRYAEESLTPNPVEPYEAKSEAAAAWEGWGTALKPAIEDWWLLRKPLAGTVAENVLTHGTGALNIDACRIATSDNLNGGAYAGGTREGWGEATGALGAGAKRLDPGQFVQPEGRWPANVVHDGSPEVEAAFAAFGERKGMPRRELRRGASTGRGIGYGSTGAGGVVDAGYSDSGSASRFFYSPKANKRDRRGSKHPTVKSVGLMRWLVRLICPRGGTVLDPFAGSGTTLEAAMVEGFRVIGIEKDAESVKDIRRRVAEVLEELRAAEPRAAEPRQGEFAL